MGCFSIGLCGWLGDAFPAIAHSFNFYNPAGPLSGETTTALAIWLVVWFVLSKKWAATNLSMKRINLISFLLLGSGLLLTFPPFGDLLQGK
jgi:hypothetical protein